jgi:hypothetical protein
MKSIIFSIFTLLTVTATSLHAQPCDHELRKATAMLLFQKWTRTPLWDLASSKQSKIGNEGLIQITQIITVNLGAPDVRQAHYFLVTATCDVASDSLYADDSDDPSEKVILKHITQERN